MQPTIFLILVCIALLQGVLSEDLTDRREELGFLSSSETALASEPSFTYDFDFEKDLSPEDRALLEETNGFISDGADGCSDWEKDPSEDESSSTSSTDATTSSTYANTSSEGRRSLSADVAARLSDLASRVQHVHGRRLCHWEAASSCGCVSGW